MFRATVLLCGVLAFGLKAVDADESEETGSAPAVPRSGQQMDVVPFGQIWQWEEGNRDYGVMFEDARDIFSVLVAFDTGAGTPRPGAVRLEYWQSGWPHRRIPRDKPSGAGGSGWLDIGDWYQGKWRQADTKVEAKGNALRFTFEPINAKEFSDLTDFAADYRTTMKLRIVSDQALPKVAAFQAFTDSTWQPLSFQVEWGGTARQEQVWDGRIEAFNGHVERVDSLGTGTTVSPDGAWRSRVHNTTTGVRANVLCASPQAHNSFDETVITVRAAQETFSFAASDLRKSGRILLPDFGVLVRKDDDRTTYAEAFRKWQEIPQHKRDLYSRVFQMPEQTLTQAWNDTPIKEHHYLPLSFEGGRQHFRMDAEGNAACEKNWIVKIRGKDTDNCRWNGTVLNYRFGLSDAKFISRHLMEGYLPIAVTTWQRDGVQYRQTAFVVPLMGVPPAGARIWADDTLVLMLRFEMSLVPGEREGLARLDMTTAEGRKAERLALKDGLVLAGEDGKLPRFLVTSPEAAAAVFELSVKEGGIAYRAPLSPGKETSPRTLDIAIPYVTLTDEREQGILRGLQFDEALSAVGGYWQSRIAAGCQIDTPERMINEFHRADAVHLLINTEREVGVSDRYMPKVGTFHYGVFSNESCMMLHDLEVRGYHQLVERSLDSWLHYQGSVGLPGDFSTKDGQFYGAAGYEMGGYNQHHGWILWMFGEHYRFTRDAAWLRRVAPKVVKGCDWVARERRRMTEEARRTPIRAIEKGLMPPGRLEDIGDWRTWLTTNIYSWRGLQSAAAALKAIEHPDGQRLAEEAEQYHQDLLAAWTEAMRRSPVVPLRDGSWVPHVPSDVHRRGRSFGWITETLEGAIHLISADVIDPNDRMATWIIKDFEDNLYLSEQFGYDMKGDDFERFWFSLGGISMQANLLHNPIPYLLRDEPQHFLRAYFNGFAVSYFPDTRMMTEHALPNIGDWRGDHFKSSDESNSTYWLRCMFVREQGNELWLGAAVPRYWLTDGQRIAITHTFTHFGPMSMRMESRAAEGRIDMFVEPPGRNLPDIIRARFRHPEGLRMARCEVNGQPYPRFDPDKEWVELSDVRQPLQITAYYMPFAGRPAGQRTR